MKFDLSDLFNLSQVDDSKIDLIYSLTGIKAMKQKGILENTELEATIQEIYKDRLTGESAKDFLEQTTFLAKLYKETGLYNQAASIYRKLAAAHPDNNQFLQELETIKTSLN
jgi:hypothetical protein